MKRADRKTSNDDNARPSSRQEEPVPYHELKQRLMTVRATLDEKQLEVDTWKERTTQNYQLYLGEQQNYQQMLYLYEQEKTKSTELLTKYERVSTERTQYLDLYNDIQAQPRYKRRSTDSPINLLQKLKLIWLSIKDILTE